MRLLLIDDAAVLRGAFAQLAGSLGEQVTTVGTQVDGLRRASSQSFDAVVVDGRLADGDVVPFIRSVVAAAPRSAVLVIASLDERWLVNRAKLAGAAGAIVRPFRISQIRDALAALKRPPPRSGRHGVG